MRPSLYYSGPVSVLVLRGTNVMLILRTNNKQKCKLLHSHLYELTNDAANPGGSLVPFGEWGFESRRCQFSFVPFCRLQMGLERNCRDTVSPARPSSLLLEDNNNMLYGGHHDDNNSSSSDGLTADIMSEDSVTNAHNCRRQRRRKRAPYSWIKRFSGESLRGSNHSHFRYSWIKRFSGESLRGSNHSNFIYSWIKRFSGESLQESNHSHSSRHTRGSNHSHFRYSWIKRFSGESLRGSNHSF